MNNIADVMQPRPLRRVVALGGGTGLPAVLAGLRRHLPRACRITAVVTAADDGGSSGILRQQYDVLPPGDVRHCLIALARVAPEVTADPVPWNWKMLLENYIEPYHTQFVHPIIHDFAPSTAVEFDGWRGSDDNVIVRYVPFLERDGSLTDKGWAAPALFPIIESLSEKQRNRVGFGMVPPNMNIIFMPDMLCYGLVFPQGPTSLRVGGGLFTAGGWCMPKSTVALTDFQARAARMMEGSRQLGEQDTTVNLAMQRAKYSRFAPRGRFSPLEETLSQFNRWLAVRYRAEAERRRYPTRP